MTALESIAARVCARGTLNPPLKKLIARHVADTAAAWVAGAHSAEGALLARFVAPPPGREGALDRILLHCAWARLSELDDIHLASATTPGALVIPAALTLAADRGAPAAALGESVLAGYEAMVRLGEALNGPAVLYRGIWPTYFIAPFGVAAVAARLLELDAAQTAHALGLALVSASPGVGHQGGATMARWLSVGHAARTGGMAALAAQAGFTADPGLLEREFLSSVYSISPRLERLVSRGPQFALQEVSFKPWCAARQTMAASQAVKELVREGLDPEDIEAITVGVPPPTLRMVNHGVTPADRASFLTSLPYQLAVGALQPAQQLRVSPQGEVPEAVRALMAKVSVQGDEALLEHYPLAWPARVAVRSSSGELERLQIHVPGDPQRPLAESELAAKLAGVLDPVVGRVRSADLVRAALDVLESEGGAASLLERIEAAAT